MPEIVTFYLRHHPHKGNPTLTDWVESFIAEKKPIGRVDHYEKSMRYPLIHLGMSRFLLSCAVRLLRKARDIRALIGGPVGTVCNASTGSFH
jgi:hypothetical protein